MAKSDMNWKHELKPWVPPALIQLYRRSRNDPRADPPFRLPVRTLRELFPGIETTTITIPAALATRGDEWAVPAAELLALAAICAHTQPCRVFEFGTYTGESTLLLAQNTPPETEIMTIDLDPTARSSHEHGMGVGGFPNFVVGAAFGQTPFANKIRQLYGDSRSFDFSPYQRQIDLVYVDADHSYSFVKADTERAFGMLHPGGVIVWDDYTWTDAHPECVGVTRCLNELAATRPVFRLAGTRFAVYVDRASAT